MKITISRNEYVPVAMYVAPDGLNITFVIPPRAVESIRRRPNASMATVVSPKELLVGKEHRVNLMLKIAHCIVRPNTVIPEGDVPIKHRQDNV
jgi:hypothetical protein